ncbi:uncharacterized protein LOC112350904 [Selaginella moellendorffii]|uniref:uncharacterized protein LOC112350904 n=1 Tax=Selaginella moellendorffii TaxID=88036 RepID=UPI000D1C8845|nr:uncharacterized protein LOC112350904 [Selaginella moellendorffii]|eukprot:XP_024543701.1 uncharacterized protein LOC112350904 [Selaginella moellendorffii]
MEEDELDELLDTMLGRSASAIEVCSTSSASPSNPGITFSFPGWGIDMHTDSKRQTAVVRHFGGDSKKSSSARERSKSSGAPLIAGSPASEIPDEVLLKIFTFLEVTDLSASRQVCKRWYLLCSSDCLWERFLTLKASSTSELPRWLELKHSISSFRISARYTYSRRGYEIFIEAIEAWWRDGQPHGKFSSSVLCPLIRKVTLSDWCVFYEVLSAAFAKRADTLAVELQKHSQSGGRSHIDPSPSSTESFHDDGVAGVEIWSRLCRFWDRYISWIKLVSLHCADLNYAVRLERVRTVETPTLYSKGVLCFRSQVILSYGLRKLLQAGLLWLSARETEGPATEEDIELLCSLHHLLQVLDVSDDFTLPADSFTQAKFRRCFLDGESSRDFSRSQIIAARMEHF